MSTSTPKRKSKPKQPAAPSADAAAVPAEPAAPALHIPDLRIEGYRLFRDLTIPKFGRVNLITGKNGAGKSALLEAIRVYAELADQQLLAEILMSRGELFASDSDPWPYRSRVPVDEDDAIAGFCNLFFGRGEDESRDLLIELGAAETADVALSLRLAVSREKTNGEEGAPRLEPMELANRPPRDAATRAVLAVREGASEETVTPLHLIAERFGAERMDPRRWSRRVRGRGRTSTCILVPANNMRDMDLARLWPAVDLRETHEKRLLSTLKLIAPSIRDVSMTPIKEPWTAPSSRVSLRDSHEPVPLRSLGEGIMRLFGISLALANAAEGILLIDEFENGIHYTVLPDLWKLIFHTARELNVQVFATTHSYDCIKAFQRAATDDRQSEGLLIRLDRIGDDVRPTLFDEEDLEVVTEHDIEVR